MIIRTAVATAALALMSTAALAQSTGASPADPNNERNQRMAPSNTQPSDPGTDTPAARVPTDPEDAASANREEGGASGTSSGEAGSDAVMPADPELTPAPEDSETPPQAAP